MTKPIKIFKKPSLHLVNAALDNLYSGEYLYEGDVSDVNRSLGRYKGRQLLEGPGAVTRMYLPGNTKKDDADNVDTFDPVHFYPHALDEVTVKAPNLAIAKSVRERPTDVLLAVALLAASPWLISSAATLPGIVGLATSMVGGELVNKGTEALTGKDFGDFVTEDVVSPVVDKVVDNPTDANNYKNFSYVVAPYLNPGYFAGTPSFIGKRLLTKFQYGGALQEDDVDPSTIDKIISRLKLVENSKSNPKGGWDAKNQRWLAHESPEGGYKTIAYGIKLDPSNRDIKPLYDLYKKQQYLTDAQVEEYMPIIAKNYYNKAKRQYEELGYNWDNLDETAKSILVDYAYNPGISRFKNLVRGFATNDTTLVRNNTHRMLNGLPLTSRNKLLDAEVNDWIATKRPENTKPQVFHFGTPTTEKGSNVITYNVHNGKPAKAEMIVQEHWFSPNDTIIRATFPSGKLKEFVADYGWFWDNIDPRFAEIRDKFNHDKSIALIKRK